MFLVEDHEMTDVSSFCVETAATLHVSSWAQEALAKLSYCLLPRMVYFRAVDELYLRFLIYFYWLTNLHRDNGQFSNYKVE